MLLKPYHIPYEFATGWCWNKRYRMYNWKYLASQLQTSLFNLLQFPHDISEESARFSSGNPDQHFLPLFCSLIIGQSSLLVPSPASSKALSNLWIKRCRKMKITESQSPFGFTASGRLWRFMWAKKTDSIDMFKLNSTLVWRRAKFRDLKICLDQIVEVKNMEKPRKRVLLEKTPPEA